MCFYVTRSWLRFEFSSSKWIIEGRDRNNLLDYPVKFLTAAELFSIVRLLVFWSCLVVYVACEGGSMSFLAILFHCPNAFLSGSFPLILYHQKGVTVAWYYSQTEVLSPFLDWTQLQWNRGSIYGKILLEKKQVIMQLLIKWN